MANNSNTPTFKQKLFAKEYVKNKGNGTQAALAVYDGDYDDAKNIANQNLGKPIVQEEIAKELARVGITKQYLHNKSKKIIDLIEEENPKTLGIATNHLQFAYKLYNALPGSKHMNLNYSFKDSLGSSDIKNLTKTIEELNKTTHDLLKDLKST